MYRVAQIGYKLDMKQSLIAFALIGQEKQDGSQKTDGLYKKCIGCHSNSSDSIFYRHWRPRGVSFRYLKILKQDAADDENQRQNRRQTDHLFQHNRRYPQKQPKNNSGNLKLHPISQAGYVITIRPKKYGAVSIFPFFLLVLLNFLDVL